VKEAIRKVGGMVNDSDCALVVTSVMNLRSVVYIQRSKVPDNILQSLDRCKFYLFVSIMCIYVSLCI
jgi:hypothetical protein